MQTLNPSGAVSYTRDAALWTAYGPADIDGNNQRNIEDLLAVINEW